MTDVLFSWTIKKISFFCRKPVQVKSPSDRYVSHWDEKLQHFRNS